MIREDIAMEFCRNMEYYRGLLDECAKHLGEAVYISDDGSRQDEPLRAKVPDLVATLSQLREENKGLRARLPSTPAPQAAPTHELHLPSGYMEESNCRKCGKPMGDPIHIGIRPNAAPAPSLPDDLISVMQAAAAEAGFANRISFFHLDTFAKAIRKASDPAAPARGEA